MTSHSRTPYLPQLETEAAEPLFDNWFDPIEAGLRDRARDFLQDMLEAELDEVLARSRYAHHAKRSSDDSEKPVGITGHRHGHRSRSLLGTFGQMKIEMPRARLNTPDGKTTEWKSRTLRAYQRRTLAADALIAGCYVLAPTRAGCGGRWALCSGARSARTR
jgi:putative transposase